MSLIANGSERPDAAGFGSIDNGITQLSGRSLALVKNGILHAMGHIMARHQWSAEAFGTQVGARIRFLRFERGFSLQELATKTRYSGRKVAQIELGQLLLTARMLRRFARALKVQPFDLLNHDPQLDDLGYLIEVMRQDPKAIKLVKRRIERARAALHNGWESQVDHRADGIEGPMRSKPKWAIVRHCLLQLPSITLLPYIAGSGGLFRRCY